MNEMQIKLLDAAARHLGTVMQANGIVGLMNIVGELNAIVSAVQEVHTPKQSGTTETNHQSVPFQRQPM